MIQDIELVGGMKSVIHHVIFAACLVFLMLLLLLFVLYLAFYFQRYFTNITEILINLC
jgi:hypothetical protein